MKSEEMGLGIERLQESRRNQSVKSNEDAIARVNENKKTVKRAVRPISTQSVKSAAFSFLTRSLYNCRPNAADFRFRQLQSPDICIGPEDN